QGKQEDVRRIFLRGDAARLQQRYNAALRRESGETCLVAHGRLFQKVPGIVLGQRARVDGYAIVSESADAWHEVPAPQPNRDTSHPRPLSLHRPDHPTLRPVVPPPAIAAREVVLADQPGQKLVTAPLPLAAARTEFWPRSLGTDWAHSAPASPD